MARQFLSRSLTICINQIRPPVVGRNRLARLFLDIELTILHELALVTAMGISFRHGTRCIARIAGLANLYDLLGCQQLYRQEEGNK